MARQNLLAFRRRKHLAGLGLLTTFAALAVILIPAGAAAPTSKPYTANICDAVQLSADRCPEPSTAPVLTGPSAVVYLSIHNQANPQSIGSANVALPASTPTSAAPQYDTANPAVIQGPGLGNLVTTASQITLRNLNLGPDATLTLKITLKNVPVCVSGTYDWGAANVIRVKQSNDFQGPPGNDFVRAATGNSLTASLGSNCHLAVVSGHQPTDTAKDQPITDAQFSSGGPIQVGLYDSSNNLVTGVNGSCTTGGGCVTAGYTGGDASATLGGTTSQPLVSGIASFGNLSLNKVSPLNNDGVPIAYALTFASAGVTGTTSGPFVVVQEGTTCSGPCELDAEFIGTGDTVTTTTNVSTNLTGSLSIQFFGQNLPSAITGDGGGCDNFIERATSGQFNGKAAAAVIINVQGSLTGDTFIDYGIPDKLLKGKYGTNYGQPNVPICIGVQRLGDDPGTQAVETTAHIPCEVDSGGPWTGKVLGNDGKLTGAFKNAVCDTTTHLWWNIAPTFQDPPNPVGFAPIEIMISSWTSATASDGTDLRVFTIKKPPPWDGMGRG